MEAVVFFKLHLHKDFLLDKFQVLFSFAGLARVAFFFTTAAGSS